LQVRLGHLITLIGVQSLSQSLQRRGRPIPSVRATVTNMEALRWSVGDATIFRIGELDATAALQDLIPKFDLAEVARAGWLTPNFVDQSGRLRGSVQAFLIMIADQVIIIDPGVGNGKPRSAVPGWNNLHTDFLDRLRAVGVAPDDVDYVIDTHLHFDHVGWHTQLVDGVWRPHSTRLAMSCLLRNSAIGNPSRRKKSPINMLVFPAPCYRLYEAGLVDLVADDHVVTDGVRLVPRPDTRPITLA
jgi:hypothetical protein